MFIDYLYKQVSIDTMERKSRKKNDFQFVSDLQKN